jgi:putative phosphoesterase
LSKKIGLISDTHGYLDPNVIPYFEVCDEIWHAGDVGNVAVIESLEAIKPTYGVFGNVDGQDIRMRFPKDLWLNRSGFKILITHIAGRPGRYNSRVKTLLASSTPHMLICGHSHILKIMRDPDYSNMLYINPGAAGKHGFHHVKTIVRFTLDHGKVSNLEVIEMGKRGTI